MDILQQAEKTIRQYNLIEKNDRILAAVSGGSDSVALLDVLCRLRDEYGLVLFVAHVNHNLRNTAKRDEEFVENLCRERGIRCFLHSADVAEYADRTGISEELAGREIRYAFFHALKKEHNISKIATAHNKNDAAESILMHFIRGSGLGGLCGIPYVREDGVIRPLLDVEKAEIEEYCHTRNLDYVVDETNFQQKYLRNQVRLSILPELIRLNPNFIESITKNARILLEDEKFLHAKAQAAYNIAVQGSKLDLACFQTFDIAIKRRVVQMLYRQYTNSPENLQAVHVAAILDLAERAKSGSRTELPRKTDAVIEYGKLYFTSRKPVRGYDIPLAIGDKTKIPDTNLKITVTPCTAPEKSTKTKIYCTLPQDGKLHIRTRKTGDLFYPVGMTGKKRISDYFTDLKIPQSERDKIPLLFCDDELVWVVGYRQDRRFVLKKDNKINYAVEIFDEM